MNRYVPQKLKTRRTLRRLERFGINSLHIACNNDDDTPLPDKELGVFVSTDSADFVRLGEIIAKGASLYRVTVDGRGLSMAIATEAFVDSFRKDDFIHSLELTHFDFTREMMGHRILDAVREKTYLRGIHVESCVMGQGGTLSLASTLAACRYLTCISICNMGGSFDGQSLVTILSAIRRNRRLNMLWLDGNNIARGGGCQHLSTLLRDPVWANLRSLSLGRNNIGDRGVSLLLNSLIYNRSLEYVNLGGNNAITRSGFRALSTLLCDTSSINSTYLSNHTLQRIHYKGDAMTPEQRDLLDMNIQSDKRLIAVKKILLHHSNLDMAPFFKWNMKMLPLAVAWFDMAVNKLKEMPPWWCKVGGVGTEGSLCGDEDEDALHARKLSAIYQFVRAMPVTLASSAPRKKATQVLAPGIFKQTAPRTDAAVPRRKGVRSALHCAARILSLGQHRKSYE